MAEANKEEVDKCKHIAQNALAQGDSEKAVRFLQKAKRMCPSDASIDALLERAASGAVGSSSGGGAADSAPPSREAEGMRHRAAAGAAAGSSASATRPGGAAAGGTRTNKDGSTYTAEQMQLVQKILRTKDYYDILEVPRDCGEDAIKKAYKKVALKLHPDKNKAPGAEEAFKKLSKAVQCLSDEDKKKVYDRYGDEDRIPQQHRQQYQQDFMTPEDLFAAFFGGGGGTFHTSQHHHHHRGGGEDHAHGGQAHRAQLFQALPILLLVLLTLASNFASRDTSSRFSFSQSSQYRNERKSPSVNVKYWVTDDFRDNYADGTRALAEFDRQVEVYYIRNLHSDCDYQDKVMYKKVMIAKRRGNDKELQQARSHPRPACKEMDRIKSKFPDIYRSAMSMGVY